MNLFYENRFLQKRQFYHNIAFIFYTKTYLLGNSSEVFSKNTLYLLLFLSLFHTDLISIVTLRKVIVFSQGKESYKSTLIFA